MNGATIHRPRTPASIDGAGIPVRCQSCRAIFRVSGEPPEKVTCPKCGTETPTFEERYSTDC